MARARATVTLPFPRPEVYVVLADPANDPRWCPNVIETVYAGGERRGMVGARYRFAEGFSATRSTTGDLEIVELDPPARIVTQARTPQRRYRVAYDLREVPGGTEVTQTSEVAYAGIVGRLAPLATPLVSLQARRQFRALERLLEDG